MFSAERSGQLLLVSVLGNRDDGRRRCQSFQRRYRQQAAGAAAYYQHSSPLRELGLQHAVHSAAQRLGHDRSLVRNRARHDMKLALVRHQLRAPAATRVATVSRLDPRRHVSLRHALAVCIVTIPTRMAEIGESARCAPEGRLEDDPFADAYTRHRGAGLYNASHHFVSGNERKGGEGREIDAALPRHGPQVRAAYAAERWADADPRCGGEAGLFCSWL